MAEPSAGLLSRLGTPVGRHASRLGIWFTAGPWALGVAVVTWLVLWARQWPCHTSTVANQPNTFYRLCYTDISVLYQTRHLAKGANPYAMEYPVLTGTLVDVARRIAALLGAPMGPGVTPQQELDGANVFFAVNAVLLFVFFLVTVLAHVDANRRRSFDALMIAAAPVVAAAGLINWDFLCIALTSLAVWAWARRMPLLAGVFIGLGVAAKLYPFLLLIPLFALCLRARRLRHFALALGGAAMAWAVPNGIVYLLDPKAWLYFWTFNVGRAGDLGSLWYVLSLAGIKIPQVSLLTAALNVLGALGVVALALLAPRRPRLGQLAFLMVCWFLMVNKVYSPQYVLWLLPFVVLARPVWKDWLVWNLAELAYFAAIWGHLAGTTTMPGATQDKVYWASVFVRLAVQGWFCFLVVRDILDPRADPIRADGLDDPVGGVLADAPDAGWLDGLRNGLLGAPLPDDDEPGPDPEPGLEPAADPRPATTSATAPLAGAAQ